MTRQAVRNDDRPVKQIRAGEKARDEASARVGHLLIGHWATDRRTARHGREEVEVVRKQMGTEVLSEVERSQVRGLVERLGEPGAAVGIGVNVVTLARALAGLGIRRGTAMQVRVGLAKLSAPAEPAATQER